MTVAPTDLPATPDSPEDTLPETTVLLVDDEPAILSALRRLLRQDGYHILTAESGREGLELLSEYPVDLVISEMRMPEMNGAQFLEKDPHDYPDTVRILITGYAEIGATIDAINRGEIYRYIAKPWDDQELRLTLRKALEHHRLAQENQRLLVLTQQQNDELKELNTGLEHKINERTATLQHTLKQLNELHQSLKVSFVHSMQVFSSLIEMAAGEKLSGHARRVAGYARQIARTMELADNEVQDIVFASLLHDVGKLGLKEEHFFRPLSQLSPEHYAEVIRHPIKGHSILVPIERLKQAGVYIRHHHELYDGGGFPDCLAGLAMPRGARILTVANEYDALQLGTITGQPLSPRQALQFLIDQRGKRYDPRVVDAFSSRLLAEHKIELSEVPLQTGRCKPGDLLARDLLHPEGYLLLAKNQTLTSGILEQLRHLEKTDGLSLVLYIQKAPPGTHPTH